MEVRDVGCTWYDCLINLVDLEVVLLRMIFLVVSNLLVYCPDEVADVSCTWFDRFNLSLDLKGLPMCTSSLLGFNLFIKFCYKGDFEGLIVILVITFFSTIQAIWRLGVISLVGCNLPRRFWCKRGFERVIILVVFSSFCKLGAVCDFGVGTLRGICGLGGGRI
jgi:hypothetical protein